MYSLVEHSNSSRKLGSTRAVEMCMNGTFELHSEARRAQIELAQGASGSLLATPLRELWIDPIAFMILVGSLAAKISE